MKHLCWRLLDDRGTRSDVLMSETVINQTMETKLDVYI